MAFLPEVRVDPSLQQLHPHRALNGRCVAFRRSISMKNVDIVWTQAKLLPDWANPGRRRFSKAYTAAGVQKCLGIADSPPIQMVAMHLRTLCEDDESGGDNVVKQKVVRRDFARWTSREVTSLSRAATADTNLSSDFTVEELEAAIKKLKSGKAPGRDNIHPEFVIHQSAKTTAWLCSFPTSCFRRSKLPKTWRRATVVALLKPNKPAQDPKSYRPISLLCVPFKILERMIQSRIDPVVDPQLPREQAGFRRGRSTVDQVTLLTQDIEDSFQNNEKAGVVFLDLTAAYDTVWHRGLHLKLLRIIPDRHMMGFIMEMLSNRSFVVHTNDGQRSRLRIMKNGVPQCSVLSPMLFNIYISDLPETTSRK